MKSTSRSLLTVCVTLMIFVSAGAAQTGSVHGRITDDKGFSVRGAHVRLVNPSDTTRSTIVQSESDGRFRFDDVVSGQYRLDASAVGHKKAIKLIQASSFPFDAGTLTLPEQPIPIGEVIIQGQVPPAVQNGDTTEYSAHAFKTNRDATAEDLLAKMPGVIVNNGTVTAGGENVQRVLVDGKPYFGDDATLALRNLPAEVIDKIQLFDQASDQALFTGFDDGQSVRALNIMTRRGQQNLEFGKTTAGYGNDSRYEVGGNFNDFHGDQRLSILGLSNNINEQNFTQQDLLGAISSSNQVRSPGQRPGRRGTGGGGAGRQRAPGGFGQGINGGQNPYTAAQQQGINTTHMLGTNYTDSLSSQLFAQGSYFFNRTDNQNQQALTRTYLLGGDSTSLYNQDGDVSSRNFNNRINGRVVYTPNEQNSFLILPQLSFQSNHADNNALATLQVPVVSGTRSTTSTGNTGYDLGGHLILRHKMDLPGRTVSLDIGLDNARKKTGTLLSASAVSAVTTASQGDSADQNSNFLSTSRTLSANLAYTEPLSVETLLQISYIPTFSENDAAKSTLDLNPVTGEYTTPDSALSNRYANSYMTQAVGTSLRYHNAELNAMAGVSYQYAYLHGQDPSGPDRFISRRFDTFLPNAMVLYNLPDHRNIRFLYRASTRPPSVTQLQQVVNNANPLLLTTGNPSLNQSYTHSLTFRYSATNPLEARSMFVFLSATMTKDYIANATVIAAKDTTVPGGVILSSGTQLTSPVNLNGYWAVRSFFTYGFPFSLISSTLNLNSGFTFTRTPGVVNGYGNFSNAWSLTEGFVIGSNISENFDFTFSYMGNYTLARNTLQTDANSNYYSHTASLKWTWIFWEGIVLRNEVNNQFTAGQASGYNQNIILWNISLGKKLFDDQRGEIKVGVADLLNQNNNVSRTITETYTEDTRNEALTRYVMASFTYTIR